VEAPAQAVLQLTRFLGSSLQNSFREQKFLITVSKGAATRFEKRVMPQGWLSHPHSERRNPLGPQAAWEQLLAAYSAGDWDQIQERATDLIAWLDRGGFPPLIVPNSELDPNWNRALARAGCLYALDLVHTTWSVTA